LPLEKEDLRWLKEKQDVFDGCTFEPQVYGCLFKMKQAIRSVKIRLKPGCSLMSQLCCPILRFSP
jgi:hypothetical protein